MNDLPGLDVGPVSSWLLDNVEGLIPPLTFSPIVGGHSNLTYSLTDAAGNDLVWRRGPLGSSSGRAHEMGREHLVLSALSGRIPVPRVFALCRDESITGATFYVMSRVHGAVLDDQEAADAAMADRDARLHAGTQLVDVLADLATTDIDEVGLGEAAAREDFLARQIRRFTRTWEQNRTRDLPRMERLAERLVALAPPQRRTGIVHGDYRIGNVMLSSDGTLTAVLDWELWTLGDTLADLGFLLNNWYEPADPTPMVFMVRPPTSSGDFGSRDEVVGRYADRTGADLSTIDYYRGFQHWRMAVIAEGVKLRHQRRQMAAVEVDFEHLDRRVLDLVDLAEHHLDRFIRSA